MTSNVLENFFMSDDDEYDSNDYENSQENTNNMNVKKSHHVRLYRRNSTFARTSYHDMIVYVIYPFVCEHLYDYNKDDHTSELLNYQTTLFYPYTFIVDTSRYFTRSNDDKENINKLFNSVDSLLRNTSHYRQYQDRHNNNMNNQYQQAICSPFRYYKNAIDYIKVAQLIINNQDYEVMDMDLNKHITISQLREYVSVTLLSKVTLSIKPYMKMYQFVCEEVIKAAELACRGLYFHIPLNIQLQRLLFENTHHSQAGTKLSIPLSCEYKNDGDSDGLFFLHQMRRKYNLLEPKTIYFSSQVFENCISQHKNKNVISTTMSLPLSNFQEQSKYLDRSLYLLVSLFEYIITNYIHEWYHGEHIKSMSGQNTEKKLNLNDIEPMIESIFQNQFYYIVLEPTNSNLQTHSSTRKSTHTALDLLTLKRSSCKTFGNGDPVATDYNHINDYTTDEIKTPTSQIYHSNPLLLGYMINKDGSCSSTSSDLTYESTNDALLKSFPSNTNIQKHLFKPYDELPSLFEFFSK